MNSAVEQALIYASAFLILATTLVVFVVQFVRMRRRDRNGDGGRDGDGDVDRDGDGG